MNYIFIPLNPEPRIDDEIHQKYSKILEDLISNSNIKNIAIMGPYGSGKTTIIMSFLEIQKQKKINKRNSIIKKISFGHIPYFNTKNKYIKPLTITIGSYISDYIEPIANNSKNEKKEETDTKLETYKKKENHNLSTNDGLISASELVIANRVEESILKQIIYRDNFSLFPKSTLIRLNKEPFLKKFFILLLICYLLCFIGYYSYKFSNNNIPLYKRDITNFFGNSITLSIFIIICIYILWIIIKFTINKIKINKVKAGDYELELNNETNMIFSKYLTEIIYFFSITKYNLVIFEDLDRFGNDIALKVIQELKELNTILNNAFGINKITFIYAVRDDLFDNIENKNKFYDYNLSIMPVSTSNNAEINLTGLLVRTNAYNDISTSLRVITTKYITDMRSLINIVNEYSTFKAIKEPQNKDKLFAMIVFKNYYYKNYNNMFKVVDDKDNNLTNLIEYYIDSTSEKKEELIDKYNFEINKAKKDILQIKRDVFNNQYEYKQYFLGRIAAINKRRPIITFSLGSESYYISEFLKDEFDITSLKNDLLIFYTDDGYSYNIHDFENIVCSLDQFIDRCQRLNRDDEISKLNKEIDELNNKIDKISNSTFKETFAKFYTEKKLKEEGGNALLCELIASGFIDEDYMGYISSPSTFIGPTVTESLTYNDSRFIDNVRHNIYSFELELQGFITVLELLKDDLESPYILNYSLLNYLIDNNDKKLNIIFKVFRNEQKEQLKFLINFMQRYPNQIANIISELKMSYIDIWTNGIKEKYYSQIEKKFLFEIILKYPLYIEYIDDVRSLKYYFEKEYCNYFKEDINKLLNNEISRKALISLNVKIKDISELD